MMYAISIVLALTQFDKLYIHMRSSFSFIVLILSKVPFIYLMPSLEYLSFVTRVLHKLLLQFIPFRLFYRTLPGKCLRNTLFRYQTILHL
jgi:hypothetical protein